MWKRSNRERGGLKQSADRQLYVPRIDLEISVVLELGGYQLHEMLGTNGTFAKKRKEKEEERDDRIG